MNARYTKKLPSGVHLTVDVWREGETLCQRWYHHDGKGTPVPNNRSISDAAAITELAERIAREHPQAKSDAV